MKMIATGVVQRTDPDVWPKTVDQRLGKCPVYESSGSAAPNPRCFPVLIYTRSDRFEGIFPRRTHPKPMVVQGSRCWGIRLHGAAAAAHVNSEASSR